MTEIEIYYDNVDLTQWVTVSDVQRNVGQSRQNSLVKIGQSDGKAFKYVSADESTIKIAGDINYDLVQKRRELAAALTKDEPKRLVFSDEPDKYYLAIVAAQPEMPEDQFHGEISISFVVPDGLAHAVTPKTVQSADGETLTLINSGTAPAPVTLDITNHGDNGFYGIVGPEAVIQIGNPDEIDGYNYTKNSRMFLDSFESDADMAAVETNKFPSDYQQDAERLSGKWQYGPGLHKDYRAYPDYAMGDTPQVWYGPSMFHGFTGTPTDWRVEFSSQVIAKTRTSLGVVEYGVVDDTGKLIVGVRIRKIDYTDQGLQLYVLVGPSGGQPNDRSNVVASWEGLSQTWIIKDFMGHIAFEKQGDNYKVTFRNETTKAPWTHTYYRPDLSERQAAGANFWTGAVSTAAALEVSLFFFSAYDNSVAWADSANMFKDGDVVHVECTDQLVRTTVNNGLQLGIQALGSKPIIIPPGTTPVQVVTSTFAESPAVTATYEERWY